MRQLIPALLAALLVAAPVWPHGAPSTGIVPGLGGTLLDLSTNPITGSTPCMNPICVGIDEYGVIWVNLTSDPANWMPNGNSPFDACRYGTVKGAGYDATTDRFVWTCANYPWSSEYGGADNVNFIADYNTATTTGGNAYTVTCTAKYLPDVACRAAGEVLRVNAMADFALAQDFTANGGTVYVPRGIYLDRGCGEQADGTNNNCPVLRPPFDTHYTHKVALGMRDIHWKGEGQDSDGIAANGRAGTMLLNDTGDANDGSDQGGLALTGFNGPAFRGWFFGLDSNEAVCATPNADAECILSGRDALNPDQHIATYGAWSRNFHLLDSTAPNAICFQDQLAVGVCQDDPRIACTTNAPGADDCIFGTNDLGPCVGPVTQLKYALEEEKKNLALLCQFNVCERDESACGFILQGFMAYPQSVPAAACAAGVGATVSITGWPWTQNTLTDALTPDAGCRVVDLGIAKIGSVENMTFAPAQSHEFLDVAGNVPNGALLQTGDVVQIVDDTVASNTCTSAGGALTGTGTFYSQCKWNGAAWVAADCDDVDDALPGCVDSASVFSTMGGFNGVTRDITITGASRENGDSGTPSGNAGSVLDSDPGGIDHAMYNTTLLRNVGQLSDSSRENFYGLVVRQNDAYRRTVVSGITALALWYGSGSVVRDVYLEGNYGYRVGMEPVAGRFGTLQNVVATGNAWSSLIRLTQANHFLIENVQIQGGYGRFLAITPRELPAAGDVAGVEHVTVRNVFGYNLRNTGFDGVTNSWVEPAGRGAVTISDMNSNVAYDAARLNDIKLSNLHFTFVTSDMCGVMFGEPANPAITLLDDWRKQVSIDGLYVNDELTGDDQALPICRRLDDTDRPYGNELGIWTSRFLPVWRDVARLNNKWPDQPYPQIGVASVTAEYQGLLCDDNGTPDALGEVPVGTVVHIADDTAANACTHAGGGGAQGTLSGGGTARSYCVCTLDGDWIPLTQP